MSEMQGRFILLRKIKFAEADLILHALDSSGSKKSFIARSALKSKKRFGGGVLEPLHYVNLTYRQATHINGLNQLHEAKIINSFENIKKNFDKLELAFFVVKCASQVSQEGDENSAFLFNLIGHTLKKIDEELSLGHLARIKLHFNLKFLMQQGVTQIDPWMGPFLKTNISDSNQLDEMATVPHSILEYSDSIDSLVQHYLKNADTT